MAIDSDYTENIGEGPYLGDDLNCGLPAKELAGTEAAGQPVFLFAAMDGYVNFTDG
jgi:hypothetical protein